MKARFIITAFLILLSVSFCHAQTIHSFMNPMGSLADVKKGNFSSTEAGFSIDLPKNIGGGGGTRGIQYNWRLTEGYYFVGIEDRENTVENTEKFEAETAKAVDRIFKDIARDLFATKFEIKKSEKKSFEYQGHKGLEVRAALTDTVVLIRVFWINNRAYEMAVLLTEAQKKFEPQAQTVFDSLKVFSKDDTNEIVRRKIEESTPQPLPQSPVAAKTKSDAEDENLKGKVKSVFAESQYIKGEKAGSPKQKDSEDYYNESGNFIKRISYDDTTGFPFQIRVYGYIDGKRVEKTGFVVLDGSIQIMKPMSSKTVQKPRDSRYSMSFDSLYGDDGKLKERTVFSNDGSLWTRTVFTYKKNMIEEITYQDNGSVSTKSFHTLDSKGNVVESTYFGFSETDWQEKSAYSYDELDNHGNWTKRTTTFYRQIRGVVKEEWKAETRRTITYY